MRLDQLGYRELILPESVQVAAIRIGADIGVLLADRDLRPFRANVGVFIGDAKVGEHDLVCDSLVRSHTSPPVPGLYSVEVKLRRVRSPAHRAWLRKTLQDEAWHHMKQRNGTCAPHWWQTLILERHWAGRVLVFVELPPGDAMQPRCIHADVRLRGNTWQPISTRKLCAVSSATTVTATAVSATAAMAKAVARPQKQAWSEFKRRLKWRRRGEKHIAGVKQFLKEAGKPHTNTGRVVLQWKRSSLRNRLRGQHFFDVDRNFFQNGGSRPGGGTPMPAASEEVLSLVYDTY